MAPQALAGEDHGGRAGLATSNRCSPLGHAHRRQGAQRRGANRFELPHKFVGAERRQFGVVITLILNGGGKIGGIAFFSIPIYPRTHSYSHSRYQVLVWMLLSGPARFGSTYV